MDKINYHTESYRQLSNANHYQKLNAPVYPRTVVQATNMLKPVQSDRKITEKHLQFLWDNCLKQFAYDSLLISKIHIISLIKFVTDPNQITLDAESIYTDLGGAMSLQAVREDMTQCALFDSLKHF